MRRVKPKHSRSLKPAAPPRKDRAGRSVFRFGLPGVLAGGILLAALMAGLWLWTTTSGVKPPAVDLSRVDASVSTTIRKHLHEAAQHPRSGTAWGELGLVLRAYDFPAQALDCLARAERLEPANPRWPYFQSLLLSVSAPAQAIGKMRQAALGCGDQLPAPRYRLAAMLAEAGDWTAAKTELEALLRVNPNFKPAQLLLARRLQALGQASEAIALARGCAEDPRTARAACTLLASLAGRQGDAAGAAEAARQAAARPPDEPLSCPWEAEADLLRGDPRQLSYQAHAWLAAGQLADAAGAVERLVKEYPQYPDTWLLLGRCQMMRKEYPQAAQSLARHLELDPQSTQGLFQLGMALLEQQRFLEAAEWFGRATQIKPDFGPAFFNRGFALARGGRRAEAVPAFREAIRHNPEHLESYLLLADLCLQLGHKEEALTLLGSAEALSPRDPRLARLRAQAEAPRPPAR